MSRQSDRGLALADRDIGARDALIRDSLGLVVYLARKVAGRTERDEVVDDLVSAGNIGLIQAATEFNQNLGFSFSTFAAQRIRGAMLDDIRSRDSLSRLARKKAKAVAAAERNAERDLKRAPSDLEVATSMGMDWETFCAWKTELDFDTSTPLDAGGPSLSSPAERIAGPDDSGESLEREERVKLVRNALATLPDQERTVLMLFYFEELKGREIATILGVTESRISQIRSSALKKLRATVRLMDGEENLLSKSETPC